MNPKLKICGISGEDEVRILEEHGVSYAGLWFGIPGGRYNLDIETLKSVSASATRSLSCMLVTTSGDEGKLVEAMVETGISAIQFHGFQPPAFIRNFKQKLAEPVQVFKVLHVSEGFCPEERFIDYYIDCGTDYFILDSFAQDGKIGSTGIPISTDFLDRFLAKWNISDRVLLAGGINCDNISNLAERYSPWGFDIDSAAKSEQWVCRNKVKKIVASLQSYDATVSCDNKVTQSGARQWA